MIVPSDELPVAVRRFEVRQFVTLLERPQKIQQVLLLHLAQIVERFDDGACLRAAAAVCGDGLEQIGGPSVMQEEDPLLSRPVSSR